MNYHFNKIRNNLKCPHQPGHSRPHKQSGNGLTNCALQQTLFVSCAWGNTKMKYPLNEARYMWGGSHSSPAEPFQPQLVRRPPRYHNAPLRTVREASYSSHNVRYRRGMRGPTTSLAPPAGNQFKPTSDGGRLCLSATPQGRECAVQHPVFSSTHTHPGLW